LKPSLFINIVLLVDGLKHNVLILSQLSDNGCDVAFNKDQCIIKTRMIPTCIL